MYMLFHISVKLVFYIKGSTEAGVQINSFGSGHGVMAGFCEHSNEPSVFIKAGTFPE
jgi:hypothetical protein